MGDTTGLPLAGATHELAVHGSHCPKLCNHTCPVLRATGRSDAVPWGFHRTVADLGSGRLAPDAAAERLVACTGCGACAGGCIFEDQDVPAQVRAGRAVVHDAGAAPPAVAAALGRVAAGGSPFDRPTSPTAVAATAPTLQLLVGCRDTTATVTAAVRLLAAAGEIAAVVVPDGCCGATLRDLGASQEAVVAADQVIGQLDDDVPVVLLDPHCRAVVEDARDLVAVLHDLVEDGRLVLDGAHDMVRWHEPCLLLDTASSGAGAALLAAAGALVELPGEVHRGCSGAGLALELFDEEAADEVAEQRRVQLAGPGLLVTACAGAAGRLDHAEAPARHLVEVLAELLEDEPESVA